MSAQQTDGDVLVRRWCSGDLLALCFRNCDHLGEGLDPTGLRAGTPSGGVVADISVAA